MARIAVITGASSGIGRALALALAREGYDVGLTARRADRLERLAIEVRAAGVRAECAAADATRRDETHSAIVALSERLGPIDLLVANAGIGLGTQALAPHAGTLEAEFRVNVFGAFYAIEAVIPSMRERRSGHVVAISSLASHRGLPGAAGYCATKAALTRLVEGMRPDWARAGIRATIVHPGYVRSELTDRNRYRMPLLMDTDRAARLIARAIRRRKKVYEFPWRMSFLVRHLVRHLPDRLLAGRIRSDKQP
ncbi:MAG: SDR family NAD(P)-dependent oxidoreductase [Acidobacteria bacterium]|nr:SDR family NAD(P)-dependent oxidoreductase [Acidobacteriota bacterium]